MITIVCILYNSDHLIDDFIDQFKDNNSIKKIIFFDNSKKINHSINEKIKIIGIGKNLGYGGAINFVVNNYVDTNWVLFANPDIKILNNELDNQDLKENTIYAPILIENSKQICGFHFPKVFSDTLLISVLRYFKPLKKFFGRNEILDNQKISEEWYQNGALILLPKFFFIQSGGFDDKFFLFYEEIDLFKRAIKLGYILKSVNFLKYENNKNSSKNDVVNIKAYSEINSFKRYYKDTKFLYLNICLMFLIISSHLILIRIIQLFSNNSKLKKRHTFLKYQFMALINKSINFNQ